MDQLTALVRAVVAVAALLLAPVGAAFDALRSEVRQVWLVHVRRPYPPGRRPTTGMDPLPPPAPAPMHPRRARIHEALTFGDRAADRITALVGSWRFILTQNWFVMGWIAWNSLPGFPHFDPPPFIGLNLLFSWQASNTGPILQLTGNRQAAKDRLRDDTEAGEVEDQGQVLAQQGQILALLQQLVEELHAHTTCVGHTTIESTPPPDADATTTTTEGA